MVFLFASIIDLRVKGISSPGDKMFFRKIMELLEFSVVQPQPYGWFHLFFFALMIAVCAYACVFSRNDSDEKARRVILSLSLVMLVFEAYKQLVFSYNCDAGVVSWSYQWYAFPFQFCSTPMYVGLVAALTKNNRLRSALYAFLGTFSIAAGFSVMVYPETVFVGTLGISIQTMVHHGLMVVMGVYLLAAGKIPLRTRTVLGAGAVLSALVAVALAIDVSTYYLGIDGGLEMFFISPFHPSTLPVLSIIYPKVPYPVFLLLYLFAFCSAAYLIIRFAMLLDRSRLRARARRMKRPA